DGANELGIAESMSLVPLIARARDHLQSLAEIEYNWHDSFLSRLAEHLDALLETCGGQCAGVLSHGDFGPWNVTVATVDGVDRCTVFDFYCAGRQSRWLDVANVRSYLEFLQLSPSLNGRRLGQLRDAFMSGYGQAWPQGCSEAAICLSYQRLCRLVDLAHRGPVGRLGKWRWSQAMQNWCGLLLKEMKESRKESQQR
ncbi:MAG: phosphotransferase, partial [Planctomycetales bacterium]|nr:phosphotransferase [Planctomycetales bacterium]